jgi:DNA-directed RNA polymerase subunit RPC12/RpoP
MCKVGDSMLTEEEKKKARYEGAKTLERVGKYEWAADAYESLARDFGDEKLLDKAGELRDRARGLQINVNSINVNELIRQLKESGLAVAYHCPNCSAPLNIDGEIKPESITKCNYCGSKIDSLPDVLKAILH